MALFGGTPRPDVWIKLEASRLDRLIAVVEPRAHAVLDKGAFDIAASAILKGRVDTGAMVNSIYVSGASGGESDYGQRVNDAVSRRPEAVIVAEIKASHRFERIVGVAVEYAFWVELQYPFLVPAVEEQGPMIVRAWSELFR